MFPEITVGTWREEQIRKQYSFSSKVVEDPDTGKQKH